MSSNSPTSYIGDIDWLSIYRRYYSIDDIVTRLQPLLPDSTDIVFSGFAEVASRLSHQHRVHLIEYSPSMLTAAQQEFSNIVEASEGNVLDTIHDHATKVALVICRISAYWHSTNCLHQLLNGVKTHNRKVIVVDFFDANRLESNESLGDLTFSDFRKAESYWDQKAGKPCPPSIVGNGTRQLSTRWSR